jgi:hypothetical protein
MIMFAWIMNYQKEGFSPEIVDRNGIVIEVLPKAASRSVATKKIRKWAQEHPETPVIFMPSKEIL